MRRAARADSQLNSHALVPAPGRHGHDHYASTATGIVPSKPSYPSVQLQGWAGVKPPDKRLTTGAYLNDWLDTVIKPTKKPTTHRVYRPTVKVHLIAHLGRIPLVKLAPEDVQRMFAMMDANPAARRYARTVLRSAPTRAGMQGKVIRNAAGLADVPPVPKKVPGYSTGDEARRLIEAARGTDVEAFILMSIGTRARQGELMALGWDDIDGDTATMQPDGYIATPKTVSSVREATLPPFVLAVLREHRQAQRLRRLAAGPKWRDLGLVFTRPKGRPLNISTARASPPSATPLPCAATHCTRCGTRSRRCCGSRARTSAPSASRSATRASPRRRTSTATSRRRRGVAWPLISTRRRPA